MDLSETQGVYNLLEEKWIPVLYGNGKTDRVGIWQAFIEAHKIRQIAASNPMDRVALLRFLMAVLLWCKEDAKSSLAALDEKSTGIPENWLAKLQEHKTAFNLLGDDPRFYQDASLKGKVSRPIGDLLVEFPTETKIAHFRHVRDKEYGLCPACCALGIIRFCAFANYAGKGYTSGINGPAPAYAIALGSTLLETLQLNLPVEKASRRKPPWLCADPPEEKDLDFQSVLAWRSRKIWLSDADGEKNEHCAHCGQPTKLIRRLAFAGGWKQPFEARGQERKFWHEDPHLIMVNDPATEVDADDSDSDTSPAARKKTTQTVLGFPRPSHRIRSHAGFWRQALRVLLKHKQHAAAQSVLIAGPSASQTGMLYQDAAAFHLCLPSDQSSFIDAVEALEKTMKGIRTILRSSTPNPNRQHPNRAAAFDALSPFIENGLCHDMKRHEHSCQADTLTKCLDFPIEQVVRSTTAGSPLRRREALAWAKLALESALIKTEQGSALSEAAVPGKPESGCKKGGPE